MEVVKIFDRRLSTLKAKRDDAMNAGQIQLALDLTEKILDLISREINLRANGP